MLKLVRMNRFSKLTNSKTCYWERFSQGNQYGMELSDSFYVFFWRVKLSCFICSFWSDFIPTRDCKWRAKWQLRIIRSFSESSAIGVWLLSGQHKLYKWVMIIWYSFRTRLLDYWPNPSVMPAWFSAGLDWWPRHRSVKSIKGNIFYINRHTFWRLTVAQESMVYCSEYYCHL